MEAVTADRVCPPGTETVLRHLSREDTESPYVLGCRVARQAPAGAPTRVAREVDGPIETVRLANVECWLIGPREQLALVAAVRSLERFLD